MVVFSFTTTTTSTTSWENSVGQAQLSVLIILEWGWSVALLAVQTAYLHTCGPTHTAWVVVHLQSVPSWIKVGSESQAASLMHLELGRVNVVASTPS
jgi:hypothetical protein